MQQLKRIFNKVFNKTDTNNAVNAIQKKINDTALDIKNVIDSIISKVVIYTKPDPVALGFYGTNLEYGKQIEINSGNDNINIKLAAFCANYPSGKVTNAIISLANYDKIIKIGNSSISIDNTHYKDNKIIYLYNNKMYTINLKNLAEYLAAVQPATLSDEDNDNRIVTIRELTDEEIAEMEREHTDATPTASNSEE